MLCRARDAKGAKIRAGQAEAEILSEYIRPNPTFEIENESKPNERGLDQRQSARGLAHSKTLSRISEVIANAPAFWTAAVPCCFHSHKPNPTKSK
jgi:hypothetical protein